MKPKTRMKAKLKSLAINGIAQDLFFLDLMEAFRRAAEKYPVDELTTDVEENLMKLTLEELERIAAERAKRVQDSLGIE